MSCFQHKLIDMITNSFRNFILNWEKIWKLLSVSYCEMFLKINMVSRPSTVKLCDHVHCETFLKINVSSIYGQTLWSCPFLCVLYMLMLSQLCILVFYQGSFLLSSGTNVILVSFDLILMIKRRIYRVKKCMVL